MAILAIAVLGAAAYANSLEGPFVFDGRMDIAENPSVRWTRLGWSELVGVRANPSRPVAYASFGLNHWWGGYDVRGYHVVNAVIHLWNAVLVYALALATLARVPPVASRRLRPAAAPWIAATAAGIFVAHPIQTQAVTYVVQRMTSLCTLFYLAALLLYVHGRTAATAGRRRALFAGGVGCWALALGSKEIAASLPLAILLYEALFFRGGSLAWLRRHASLGILGLVVLGGLVGLYLGSEPLERLLGGYDRRDFTLGERLLTQPRVVWLYLSLLVLPLPSRLNLVHDLVTSQSLLVPPTTLLALAGVVGLAVLGTVLARRMPVVSFALLWFLLHLALESSVIPLEMVFEHRLYLPMVGVSLGAAWGLYAVAGREAVWPVAVAAAVVLLLALGTHQRNRVWQDEVTLWSDAVAKSPRHARAHVNLGVALAQRGRPEQAMPHLREGVRLDRDFAEAHFNLALALAGLGRIDEAESHLMEALRLRPSAGAHLARGDALKDAGRPHEALTHYEKALELEPDSADAHHRLAWLLATCPDATARDGRRALDHARRAVALAGEGAAALDALAAAHAELGDFEAAVRWEEEALRKAPVSWRRILGARLALYRSREPFRDVAPRGGTR